MYCNTFQFRVILILSFVSPLGVDFIYTTVFLEWRKFYSESSVWWYCDIIFGFFLKSRSHCISSCTTSDLQPTNFSSRAESKNSLISSIGWVIFQRIWCVFVIYLLTVAFKMGASFRVGQHMGVLLIIFHSISCKPALLVIMQSECIVHAEIVVKVIFFFFKLPTTPVVTTFAPTLILSSPKTLCRSAAAALSLYRSWRGSYSKNSRNANIDCLMIMAVLDSVSVELFLVGKKLEAMWITKFCHLKRWAVVKQVEERFFFKKQSSIKEFDLFYRIVLVDNRTSGRLLLVRSRLSTISQAR